jgi:hypothetical protein
MSSRDFKTSTAKSQVRVHVVPKDSGWMVRREGAGRSTGVYRTQAEATEAAKSALRRSGGELMVQGRDGRYRESITLGRDQMARISAVEGIRLSAESKRTLKDLDAKGASGDERRRWIARQFGKKA